MPQILTTSIAVKVPMKIAPKISTKIDFAKSPKNYGQNPYQNSLCKNPQNSLPSKSSQKICVEIAQENSEKLCLNPQRKKLGKSTTSQTVVFVSQKIQIS